MQKYFIIKSTFDNKFVILDYEDKGVFASQLLSDCIRVKNNLEKSNAKNGNATIDAMLSERVRSQDVESWDIIPDGYNGSTLLDDEGIPVVQHVSFEMAFDLLQRARSLSSENVW
jgi:hypothetical protein